MECFIIAGLCFLAAYGFGYFLMRRVQALLLEYFVTLVASTIPLGIILSIMNGHGKDNPEDLTKAIFCGLLPGCLVIGGSVWGVSVSNRLKILGTARRLSMMALGWGFVLSLCSFGGLVFLPVVDDIFRFRHGPLLFMVVSITASALIVGTARRLEAKAAPFAPRPGSDQITRLPPR